MMVHEGEQIVEAIEQAVENGVTTTLSTRPCTCAVCGGEITPGAPVVELSDRWSVCRGCFDLFTICPAPRPME